MGARQAGRVKTVLQPMEQEEPAAACSTEQFIDVEALEQDEEHHPPQIDHNSSDIIPPHSAPIPGGRKSQRSHQEENSSVKNDLQCTQRPKNLHSTPALLKGAGVESNVHVVPGAVKQVWPATYNSTKGVYTSVLKERRQIVKQSRDSSSTDSLWKQRTKNAETGHFRKPPQQLTISVRCS